MLDGAMCIDSCFIFEDLVFAVPCILVLPSMLSILAVFRAVWMFTAYAVVLATKSAFHLS